MNSPLLTIKIGNSNVTLGVYQDALLVARWRIHTQIDKTADEYAILLDEFIQHHTAPILNGGHWQGLVMVSVVPPLTTTFQDLCRRHWQIDPLVVGHQTKTGMPIRYDNPRALGADRLVAAIAAKAKFGAPIIVIDFGTATTFNAVNRSGEFIGGAIAPGLVLSADALHQRTAQLPRIDLLLPPRVIATNPIHGIQSGILFGYVSMIEGMIARMRAEMREPNARVIATGGLAAILAPQTKIIEVVERDLVLDGLRIIFEMNKGTQT